MALLNELKLRTESIIRKRLDNQTFLLWANEALEQLSEIAKVEVEPLEPKLNKGTYDYLILNDGTHLFRTSEVTFEVSETVYYDTSGDEWVETSLPSTFVREEDVAIEQSVQINGRFYQMIQVKDYVIETLDNYAPEISSDTWSVVG